MSVAQLLEKENKNLKEIKKKKNQEQEKILLGCCVQPGCTSFVS